SPFRNKPATRSGDCQKVAGLPWNTRQVYPGIGGRFIAEHLAGLERNSHVNRFLQKKHIQVILKDQLHRYGGEYGIRDSGLAESAIAAPQGSFGGALLHEGPIEQAAAYLFHLCSNHPFLDGNKRVALAAALVFLDLHGIEVHDRDDELYELVMGVAQSDFTKKEIIHTLSVLISMKDQPKKGSNS
ncbi:MAG: type II toxin-antitoxin system death-on-curing family toxin, partial [Spirochaeta sp.]|nr:type II toxin-antitoxin system death-on-curing family toxin [Spirochaeta sp.]